MRPTLYQFSGAPRGWRVLLGLAFKGIQVEIKTLSLADRDHHKADFKALNPRATVPVLVSGDTILRDSIAILAWLDRAFPEKPLFGNTQEEAAQIWQITMECADYLRGANHQFLTQVFSSEDNVPAEGSTDAASLNAGAELVHAECRYIENLLSDGRPFLAGASPTAAEAVTFPEIQLLQRAVLTKNDMMASVGFGFPPDVYPKTAGWKDRLNDMPEVAATMPRHWNKQHAAA